MQSEFPLDPGDFHAYYRFAPTALAIRECARLRAVRRLTLPEPILDVGCGDGVFARLAYPDKQVWGIDINATEVSRAQATDAYRTLVCGNICEVDLPAAFFGSAIANCSLEHVPDLDAALRNIRRALKPDAPAALIVPAFDWTKHMATVEVLRTAGLARMADAYGRFFDRLFSHVHLYDAKEWSRRMEAAGFHDVSATTLVDRATSWAFDLFLAPSTVGFLTKKVTGHWVVAPPLRVLTEPFARKLVDAVGLLAPKGEGPGEYLLVGHA